MKLSLNIHDLVMRYGVEKAFALEIKLKNKPKNSNINNLNLIALILQLKNINVKYNMFHTIYGENNEQRKP